MSFTEPTWDLDAICICGHTARRHHPRGHAHAFTCSVCSCLYMEAPPVPDDRPLHVALADAIRCSDHIQDRLLRARYIAADLGLRGWQLQRVTRGPGGRFTKETAP